MDDYRESITRFRNSIQVMHINATEEHLAGNQGIGRYIFLAGSRDRAKVIAQHFTNPTVLNHPRGHDLYLGELMISSQEKIDVAAISTGMGPASTEIIVNELFSLGGRRFIRVGTCGSLQPDKIKVGHVIIATGAIRDEDTTSCYVPTGYPALASFDFLSVIKNTLHQFDTSKTFFGLVHSKNSFYARQILKNFFHNSSVYMEQIVNSGVLATEMECSALFTLSSIFDYYLGGPLTQDIRNRVISAAVLAVIGDGSAFSPHNKDAELAVETAILIAVASIKSLAVEEKMR